MKLSLKTAFAVSITIILSILVSLHILADPILEVVLFNLLLFFQGVFSIYWMIYAWENGETIEENTPPDQFLAPHYSFTAIIPARHEEKVIIDTIKAVNAINYPSHLKEILIVCRSDDQQTIVKVKEAINLTQNPAIRLIEFSDKPINKPHGLNIGLKEASGDIIVVFDAEDQPNGAIYHMVNTKYLLDKLDVIQAGVQLMNFRSSWFSTINVLEYFFWFKSTLHYFSTMGVVPLGGNTVFFKKEWIDSVGGWDENCLTEDADIGMRLSVQGAKIGVLYEANSATREETPTDWKGFIKQRTRWHQGFMQVFIKGDWLKLPTIRQKLLASYMLVLPEIQGVLFLITPFSFFVALTEKLPVNLALLTSLPLIILILQLITYCVGLYEFCREYKLPFPFYMPIVIFLTFFPYQAMLGISAFRAIFRLLTGKRSWEKTLHINAHRLTGSTQVVIYD